MTPQAPPPARPVFTVTELTRAIKTLLEHEFPLVWVTGEISNLHRPASGHHYFTLKDPDAQIGAVMFKGQAARLGFALSGGLAVVGLGRLAVYEPRGTYQIIFEHLEPQGRGALHLAFEQLKSRLAEEGLFDPARKRKPPLLPRKVHLITSPTGAVVHDIIQIIQRRFPNMPITVIPTRVQGDGAENDIVRALACLNRQPDAELAILARGGGSLEDLQPFNSESVARALAASSVPVISAVGHETDVTIADFAADERAPTPSAAAEMAVPEKHRLQERYAALTTRLVRRITTELAHRRKNLDGLARRLRDPRRRTQELRIRLDDVQGRLLKMWRYQIEKKKARLAHSHLRLCRFPIRSELQILHHRLDQNTYKLRNTINKILDHRRTRFRESTHRLATLNPVAILERGYSITRALPAREVVKSVCQIRVDQQVEVQLASGILVCRIEGTYGHGEEIV